MGKDEPKNILVVEDEKPYARALVLKLEHAGFSAKNAGNGEEALALIEKEKFDLILLDLVMPKMDGMATLRELRKYDEWGKYVPVFILSALSSSDDKINKEITELEPTYYFEKTNTKIETLVEKIKEKLGSQ